MLRKSLLDLFHLRLSGTLTKNNASKPFIQESSHSVRHTCKTAKDDYTVDYELNLPNISMFSCLAKDPATEKKIKLVLMEHALARMSGENVPRSLTVGNMHDLLERKTACERLDFFDMLYLQEARQNTLKLKRSTEGRTEWEKNRKFLQNSYEAADHIRYAVKHNCLHKHIEGGWIKQFYATRLAQAALFGQQLVFDFGYDQYMTTKQCSVTAKLIHDAYVVNRHNREPFDLYFTNYDPTQCIVAVETDNLIHSAYGRTAMFSPSEKNYLEIFPNNKCIYLSPHADAVLQSFDNDAVYVIGAYWVLDTPKPKTVMKARKDGVPCFKLPVEKYSKFYPRYATRMNFTTMIQTLLEMKRLSTLKSVASTDTNEDEKNVYKSNRFKFLLKDYW